MMCACGHPAAGHYVIGDDGVIVYGLADGSRAHCGELGCHCRVVARVDDDELPGQTDVYTQIAEEW